MRDFSRASLIAAALMLSLSACAPAGAAAGLPAESTSQPTLPPQPSPTIPPAFTATPTITPIPPSPTAAGTPAAELACKLNWQAPQDGTKLEPRTDFAMRWNVTNTGTAAWEPGEVDLIYAGGTRMFYSPVVPLPERVAPGQSITLSAGMKAQRDTRAYVTTYTLRRGEAVFCSLSVRIYVQWSEGLERNW